MLMLTRLPEQTIVIYDNSGVIVTIIAKVSIRRGQISLGFEAPSHIRIDRGEVYARKMALEHDMEKLTDE